MWKKSSLRLRISSVLLTNEEYRCIWWSSWKCSSVRQQYKWENDVCRVVLHTSYEKSSDQRIMKAWDESDDQDGDTSSMKSLSNNYQVKFVKCSFIHSHRILCTLSWGSRYFIENRDKIVPSRFTKAKVHSQVTVADQKLEISWILSSWLRV